MAEYGKQVLEQMGGGVAPLRTGELKSKYGTAVLDATGTKQFTGPRAVETDVEGSAGVGTIAGASFADKAASQIDFYSRQMKIPKDRFGIVNGRIVYEQDDGSLQAVVPEGWSPGALARRVAPAAGQVLPITGGVAGSIAGAGAGPVGAVAGGGLGAAAGEAANEAIGNALMGDPYSGSEIVTAGALDAGFTMAGALVAKGVSKALASKAAKQVERYVKQAGLSTVDALKKAADDFGITLTPAELTNIGKLRGGQKALSSLPESAAVMEDFYGKRAGQVSRVVDDYLGGVSQADVGLETAGRTMRGQAGDVVKGLKDARTKAASPFYERAFESGAQPDVSGVVRNLDDLAENTAKNSQSRRALEKIRGMLASTETVVDEAGQAVKRVVPETNYRRLHSAKINIDRMIEDMADGKLSVDKETLRAVENVKNELTTVLRQASPDYEAGYQKFIELSPAVDEASDSALGGLSKVRDPQIEAIPAKLFQSSSPSEVAKARKLVTSRKGGEDAWNMALRSYLSDTFEQQGKIAMSNISRPQMAQASQGPRWWAQMMGDPRQARRLEAAMTPQQFSGFRKMMQVLEATGRALDGNSDTAFKQEFIKALRQDASGGLAGGIVGNAGKINPLQLLSDVQAGYRDFKFGKNTEKLAEAITSPDALQKLAELRGVSNKSAKSIIAVAQVLGWTGANAVSGAFPEGDRPVGSFAAPPQGQPAPR